MDRKVVFTKIQMENFKCFESMEYEFKPSSFVGISGSNGSGKTTIYDALFYALYDETTNENSGESVIRKKSKKDLKVLLEFKINEDNYKIENYRKHSKQGDNKLLFKNDVNITASTRRDTNNLIENILLPKSVFKNCVLFSSLVKKSFVTMKPAEQKEILNKILDLEKYDEYKTLTNDFYKNLEQSINNIDANIANKEEEINKLNIVVNTNLESDKKSLNELELKLDSYKASTKEFKNPKQNMEQEIEKLNDFKNIKNDREKEITKLESLLSNLKTNYEKDLDILNKRLVEKLETSEKEVKQKYNSEVDKLSTKLKSINDSIERSEKEQLKDLEAKKNELRLKYSEQLQKLDVSKNELEHSLISLKDKLSSYSINKDKLIKEQSKLENIINHYSSHSANERTCIECGQMLETNESKKLVKEKFEATSNKIKELVSELNEINSNIKTIENQANNINLELKEKNDNITKTKTEANKKLAEAETEIKSKFIQILRDLGLEKLSTNTILNSMNDKQKDEIESAETIIRAGFNKKLEEVRKKYETDNVEPLDKIESIKSAISSINSEIEKINNNIKTIEHNNDLEKELNNKILVLSNDIEKLNNKIKNYKDNEISKLIKEYETNLKEYKTKAKESKDNLSIAKFWKEAFSDTGIRALLINESIPVLNKKASELSKLTENLIISFDSQHELKSGDYKNKFSINALNTKNLSSLEEFSGGEDRLVSVIVLLSLRYLLETMYGISINLYLFDEILDGIDPNKSQNITRMLRKLSETSSVIFISHTLRNFIETDETLSL